MEDQRRVDLAMARRITPRNKRGTAKRTERKGAAAGKGFAAVGTGLRYDRRPKADADCACGSGKAYGECCSAAHEALKASDAAELVRARYSAYCYRLPDFLIETTDPQGEEWRTDVKAWKKELLQFSDEIDFQSFAAEEAAEAAANAQGEACVSVPFRATFLKKGTINIMDLCETSTLVQRDASWLYARGEVSYDSPKQ